MDGAAPRNREERSGMTFFNLPEIQYSLDGGKTWRTDGPLIAPRALVRIVKDGKVLFSAHAEEKKIRCTSCQGTGEETRHEYVQDDSQ
jgi:hypothetical protein